MKIIGLMVTYNEHHFIRYSLPGLLEIVDEVVVLDGSTDKTREYLSNYDKVVVYHEEDFAPMSYQERRQFTLDRARERNGTHFVCIDADEVMDIRLSKHIKGLLPVLRKGQGISCQWFHIIENLYRRSDSIDCNIQAIAWVDDGSNLMGRNAIHEDKFPPGHPNSVGKYVFIDKPLLHFGGVDTQYFIEKRMYYKCVEYLDTHDISTINLTYYRKLGEKTVDFFCQYPKHINNGILHGPHNDKFLVKIYDLIRNNPQYINDFYKLDLWRYNPSIIDYCKKYLVGFDERYIRYNSKRCEFIIYWDMTIRQIINLIITGNGSRILMYIYRHLLWRIYGDASSSY